MDNLIAAYKKNNGDLYLGFESGLSRILPAQFLDQKYGSRAYKFMTYNSEGKLISTESFIENPFITKMQIEVNNGTKIVVNYFNALIVTTTDEKGNSKKEGRDSNYMAKIFYPDGKDRDISDLGEKIMKIHDKKKDRFIRYENCMYWDYFR